MFDEILQRVIATFRRFQLQMRLSQRKKRCGQCFVCCFLRIFQDRFENRDRAVGTMQGHLESAAKKVAQSFFGSCGRLHFFEQLPCVDRIRFIQVNLNRPQLRSNVPFWIARQFGKTLERFIRSSQSAQHFRGAE